LYLVCYLTQGLALEMEQCFGASSALPFQPKSQLPERAAAVGPMAAGHSPE
jgi:hypothetical protein